MADVSSRPIAPHELQGAGPVDLALFPDGLKTTGQHEPLPEFVRSFENYPKEITGSTAWLPEDFKGQPERWTHRFTPAEIDELSATADAFIAAGTPLTGISKVCIYFNCKMNQTNRVGQLPSSECWRLLAPTPRGAPPRPRLHPVQGPACDRMGQCQIRRCIHGPGHVSGILCEPE